MTEFIVGLRSISAFLFDTLTKVFNAYTTVPVLVAVFGLWLLDRVFGIFDILRR